MSDSIGSAIDHTQDELFLSHSRFYVIEVIDKSFFSTLPAISCSSEVFLSGAYVCL